ncbi:hypothetical protein ACOI1H_14660 [Loktanella sp. DJP18]|uniref:hypothetical protein n=1 Tax=Loktanella sp. DJP18 TaxID=3409788 RepID=UPI003BB4EAFC
MKLAQTLAGNWVITAAHPDEEGWETQLASFETSSTAEGSAPRVALETAAAALFAQLSCKLPNACGIGSVHSHDTSEAKRMLELCKAQGFALAAA